MYPSCSIFAKDTFNKFGFFKGYLLTMDRLTRCGHDLHSYSHIMLNGKEYSIDFIESNIDSVFEGNK
jgi:hypothetical protein